MRALTLPLATVALLLTPMIAAADEIEDALNAALTAHKGGDLKATTAAVQKAVGLLQTKAAAGLSAALPSEIGIWKAGKLESQSLEGAGGGHSLRRSYRHGEKDKGEERRGTVVVTVDSPLLEKVASFLTNPEIGALLGAKPVTVGKHKAVHIEKQGIIQFIVNQRFLVAVEGKKLKKEELLEIAQGVLTEHLK
jgi:hypothetical protein